MSAIAVHHQVDVAPDLPADVPTVVMAGSLGSTLSMWDPQVPELSARYRVVRYDTRGHGSSPVGDTSCRIDDLADDLLALIDRLDVGPVHLVGLSLGGMTAMRLAARNPGRVRSLTVLCTSALLGPAEAWLTRAATVRESGTGAVADAVVSRWFSPDFLAAEPDRVAHFRTMIASTPAAGYAACCEAIAAMDLRADLRTITAPTLVIGGIQDPATPPPHLEAIAAGIGGSSLVMLEPAAHLANVEQSTAVTAALLQHLHRVDTHLPPGPTMPRRAT
jgi:3-oxoadipate enol-lactonase